MRSETKEQAREKLMDILLSFGGWCTEPKARKLFDLVLEENPGSIVEVGVHGGRSLAALGWASLYLPQHCKVYGFDSYQIDRCTEAHTINKEPTSDPDFWSTQNLGETYQLMIKSFKDAELEESVITIPTTGTAASTLFTDGVIDMLHIDGNHTEWCSTRDVLEWIPKVRGGGIVILDDTNFPSLQTAIRFTEQVCDLEFTPEDKQFSIYRKKVV